MKLADPVRARDRDAAWGGIAIATFMTAAALAGADFAAGQACAVRACATRILHTVSEKAKPAVSRKDCIAVMVALCKILRVM